MPRTGDGIQLVEEGPETKAVGERRTESNQNVGGEKSRGDVENLESISVQNERKGLTSERKGVNERKLLNNDEEAQRQEKLEKWYRGYISTINANTQTFVELQGDEIPTQMLQKEVYASMANIQMSHGYCIKCKTFLDDYPRIIRDTPNSAYPINRPRFSNIMEMEAGNLRGCRFCTLLLQCICQASWLRTFRAIDRRLVHLHKDATIYVSINIYKKSPDCRWLSLNLPGKEYHEFFFMDSLYAIPVEKSEHFGLRDVSISIDCNNDYLETAKQWIAACSKAHDLCRPRMPHRLPTRLLFLDGEHVKLVETAGWGTLPRYATLSHCWGKLDFIRLTIDSLKTFKVDIRMDRLTKTFKDAISITQTLGIKYLWIDSLCIVQDSTQDWEVESALMASVYGGSSINIAATAAIDGNGGCFLRDPSFVGKVQTVQGVDSSAKMYSFAPSNLYYHGVPNTHLAERAWCFQERLLAPRTLHFGTGDLFWECKTKDACESFPNGISNIFVRDDFRLSRKPLSDIWHEIVALYSGTKLTYSSDKLIALSGVAYAAQLESNGVYCAGLWRADMEEQLCWSPLMVRRPRPKGYRAPSWSWAAIDGEVSYQNFSTFMSRDRTLCTKVMDVQMTLSSTNPFGQVRGGNLTLGCTAMLFGVYCTSMVATSRGHTIQESNIKIAFFGGEFLLPVELDCSEEVHDSEKIYVLPIAITNQRDTKTVKELKKEGTTRWMATKKMAQTPVLGLLLRPIERLKDQYQRVGSFRLEIREERHRECFRMFVQALEGARVQTARGDCGAIAANTTSPDEQFIISVL